MSAQRQPDQEFITAEYLQFEKDSPTKHEYYQGQIFAMADTSTDHNRIAGQVFVALNSQLDEKDREPLITWAATAATSKAK